MVVLTATAALAVTSVIWVLWRITIWLRRGGDPVREAGVAVLFLWSLAVVELTFFPLIIIFYDWHSAENLVPFASILQLLRETAPQTAFYNIAGNLALFVPFGILLPLLFERLRALWPLVWRAGVISIAIELTQVLTRARAIDVDDVILNTTGAAVGFAVYWVIAAVAQRSEGGRELWDRLGAQPDREPLLLGVAPIGLSVAIVIPMMLSTIVAGTLGEGRGGILGYAVAELPGSEVVARTDVAEYTFVLVGEGDAGARRGSGLSATSGFSPEDTHGFRRARWRPAGALTMHGRSPPSTPRAASHPAYSCGEPIRMRPRRSSCPATRSKKL